MKKQEPYERVMIVTIKEVFDGDRVSWEATAKLPDGRYLGSELSEDMPCSPGGAMESAGRMVDRWLAVERWEELHGTSEEGS